MSDSHSAEKRLYQCNCCELIWEECELVHPKHAPEMILCPDCHETVTEIGV